MNQKIIPRPGRPFWRVLLLVAVWINASEIFRYFMFVMPMIRDSFQVVPNVAPVNVPVFISWMIWDTVLIFAVFGFVWIFLDRYGGGWQKGLLAGTLVWGGIFGLLWLGLLNMNLATFNIVAIALSLSWFEMAVAALIINWGRHQLA